MVSSVSSACRHTAFFRSLSGVGIVVGVLFFAASLTPTLVPRAPPVQGVLSGFCLAAGYGLGMLFRWLWLSVGLLGLEGKARDKGLLLAAVTGILAATFMLWWATRWQNRLRTLMGMETTDSSGFLIIVIAALVVFVLLSLAFRLFSAIAQRIFKRLARHIPGPATAVIALCFTAVLFWMIGNGLLVNGAMRVLDGIYRELDSRFEEASLPPTDPLKTGAPASSIDWSSLGRTGRRFISGGPDRTTITRISGASALEPLRVYVGLNSADTPHARAQLALQELIRINAFDRSSLVIVTPTGTGWVDPESQSALEYVLRGDVASVAVQYSYLSSWIALLADADYGVETSRAVFAEIYGHWHRLPRDRRPKLYLHGLSLGALNSDSSHDLHQVIGDPYHGALWAGPPFSTNTWLSVNAMRNPGTPAWLPVYRDGSVVRYTAQRNTLRQVKAPWGPYRVIFLQYASDAVTFFDPHALWRRPDWMSKPLGPDVSPDLVWIPAVTFLQLGFDMMFAVAPPKGFGHVYAFGHYVDAWASLTDQPGWTDEGLDRMKQRVAQIQR